MTAVANIGEQARETYRQSLAAELPLTGAKLGEMFDRSERWGRGIIQEVKSETAVRPPVPRPATLPIPGNAQATEVIPAVALPEVLSVLPQENERQSAAEPAADDLAVAVPRWVMVATVIAVAVVAAVAAAVSYDHMRVLADRAGEGWRSVLLPLSPDGLIIAASMVAFVRNRLALKVGKLPWFALFVGLGVSVAANVGTALMPAAGPLAPAVRMMVAGFPPVALLIAAELLMGLIRTAKRSK